MNDYERQHIERLRPYLGECCVLLRSDGSFPLEGPCRIAAYGNGVRHTVKGGTGSGDVYSRYFVKIEKGLEEAGFELIHRNWQDDFERFLETAKKEFHENIKKQAKQDHTNVIVAAMGAVMKQPEYDLKLDYSGDASIYVVSRISGEGNDRLASKGDFLLTESETRDILKLNKHYEKFLLVINAGGPVDLSGLKEVRNILVLSQLGVETGHALADLLLGKTYPSGRLTTTWAGYDDYSKLGDFAQRDDTRYREGIYVGYRYFDAMNCQPLFPFGYGLDYTTFERKIRSVKAKGSIIETDVEVTNTGKHKGKDTVQIYISCPSGKLDREVKSLAGFAKTKELEPGQKQLVKVRFDLKDLAAYDTEDQCYILEKGEYILLYGSDSLNVKAEAVLLLEEDFIVRQVKNLFGKTDFEDHRNQHKVSYDTEGLKTIRLDLHSEKTDKVVYDKETKIDQRLNTLRDEDLINLNIGAYKGFLAAVIGSASSSVAGAAGESYGGCEGIRPLVMADGPAGLRLSRYYYVDKKGIHQIDSTIPEEILAVLPKIIRWFVARKPKLNDRIKLKEQFTTALPIETAIAQSWDIDLAKLCGDIVGEEMKLFNVDLWLAPALNIHRHVLCGRNFEYLSEDPLLSGFMAAALCEGVQAHEGCGATIKHFAANNQETNRYSSNSMVSERALREIYLKGFDICIRKAHPLAVMSSYNLINAVHTSESHELCTEVLRDEFGYDGLLMTDWIAGGFFLATDPKYPVPDAARVAAAGTTLFMPGSRKEFRQISKGLKKGTVSRRQLMINSTYLLKTIDRLDKK